MNNDTLITDLSRLRDIAPTAEIRQRLSPLVERAESGFYRQPGRIPVLVEALNALDDLAVPAPDFGLHLSRVQALAGNGFYHIRGGDAAMTRCTDCEYPHLCRAARRPEDHLAPDGKYREIIGCDVNEYVFGDEIACPQEKRRSGRGRA